MPDHCALIQVSQCDNLPDYCLALCCVNHAQVQKSGQLAYKRYRLRRPFGSLILRATARATAFITKTIGFWGSKKVRLVIWNIRYGAGAGAAFNLPVPGAGYLRSNRKNLKNITTFLKQTDADVVGLIEVDTGSIRSGVNQAQSIGEALGHYSLYQCKYGETSINQRVPVLRKQSNAFLAAPRVHGERFHYFDTGIKRLIIELELDDVAIFLVHLSLKYRHRQYQLRYLHELTKVSKKPVIVAGDFNTFWGDDEMYLFREAAKLTSANTDNLPSYPAHAPRRELDFILYGDGIKKVSFSIPKTRLSDHLPLIFDFTVD